MDKGGGTTDFKWKSSMFMKEDPGGIEIWEFMRTSNFILTE